MSGGHRLSRLVSLGILLVGLGGIAASPVPQGTQRVVFQARVGPATAVHVSADALQIDAADAEGPVVVGVIDVEACARTAVDGEVVLTVQALRDPRDLARGAPSDRVSIDFSGSDAGMRSGTLSTDPQVAGRWTGSGVRRGRMTFTLRSSGPIGAGTVPLRFLVSVP